MAAVPPGFVRVVTPQGGRVSRQRGSQRSLHEEDAEAERFGLEGCAVIFCPAGFLNYSNEIRPADDDRVVFRQGAFAACLREIAYGLRYADANLNHDQDLLVATTRNRTLTFSQNRDGLMFNLQFTTQSEAGRRLCDAAERGQITGCSIAYHKRDYMDCSSAYVSKLDVKEADIEHVAIMLSPQEPACPETAQGLHYYRL